jgi:1,4-alpha-glucan branching enzyme
MPSGPVISVVLEAHEPFFCKTLSACSSCFTGAANPACGAASSLEELRFFESLSETYIPLLEMLERLDRDHLPFRLGISVSPILCHHLEDRELLGRYLDYTARQIEFGKRELRRYRNNERLKALARRYYDRAIERRFIFSERYERNILKALAAFQRKGKIELLAAAATRAFLPFYTSYPEAVQAQIEVALSSYHRCFGKFPQGFFLSDLGWTGELERLLRVYNLGYTVVEAHGLVYGDPPAQKGSFYPVRTLHGVSVLGRDYYSGVDMGELSVAPVYRDNRRDSGYDLPAARVGPFLGSGGARGPTGYKYYNRAERAALGGVYDPRAAAIQAGWAARLFLERCLSRLRAAAALMEEAPLSLCVFRAGDLGRSWHEGFEFLEQLFRRGARIEGLRFMTPAEYLSKQRIPDFQISLPSYSSGGFNGYGETWLEVSNDWMYPHVFRALERMIELAERFPDVSGLKERALNQAAREILLAQSSDWPAMLYRQESSDLAASGIEDALRNFTTIYEALGSSHLSTEWLTNLEKRHAIFPHINYRIFRRKK